MTLAAEATDWRLGFQSLDTEHVEPIDLTVDGTVPVDLAGTLYRIGPTRHEGGR
jgi:carotenoid cleavage dioxygenase-like enzyme